MLAHGDMGMGGKHMQDTDKMGAHADIIGCAQSKKHTCTHQHAQGACKVAAALSIADRQWALCLVTQ